MLGPNRASRVRLAEAPLRTARVADTSFAAEDRILPPWPGATVSVGRYHLFVRATPGGPDAEAALYIHGLGGSSTNWTDLAWLLSPWLAGEALDLPGFGRSFPPPADDSSLRSHVRAVIEYLEYVKRGPVHLFGNSMGGAIAIVVAASRPDLVRTLTLVSPAVPDLRPRWRRQDPVLPLMMLPGLGTALLRRLEQASPEIRVRRMLQLCFADPTSVPPERLTEAVAEIRYRARLGWASDAVIRSLRGLVASYLAPGASRMWARMGAIRAPTLVVWGDRDRLVNVTRAARTAKAIPGARLLVIRDVGHVAPPAHTVTPGSTRCGRLCRCRNRPDHAWRRCPARIGWTSPTLVVPSGSPPARTMRAVRAALTMPARPAHARRVVCAVSCASTDGAPTRYRC